MRYLLVSWFMMSMLAAKAQDPDELELRQEAQERAVDAEPLSQDQAYRLKHPLPINTASREELLALGFLNPLQVQSLIDWRNRMGLLLIKEELQSVPYWDAATVLRIMPFIVIDQPVLPGGKQWWKSASQSLVLRHSRQLPAGDDYTSGRYAGSADRLSLRWRVRYLDRLRLGVSLEKDPGEPWAANGRVLDFMSTHLFWQGRGLVRAIALGDFTVNMGQGLVQWQAPAFGGGSDLSGLKRQGAFLQPFGGGDESRFCRGAGITVGRGAWQASAYVSFRNLGASLVSDTTGSKEGVSSINESGYHRTITERENQDKLHITSTGGRLQWERGALRLGVQARMMAWNRPLTGNGQPYTYLNPVNKNFQHASLDWGYTFRNLHSFGEIASDGQHIAFISGLLLCANAHWDLGILYRRLPAAYWTFQGDAFTKSAAPRNEEGLYIGLQIRPSNRWRLDAWGDGYHFPGLRYGYSAPSAGWRSVIQMIWAPNKQTQVQARYRASEDPVSLDGSPLKFPGLERKAAFRLQVQRDLGGGQKLALRSEALWTQTEGGLRSGYLLTTEGRLPTIKRLALTLRLQFFATDSYNERLYNFESDGSGAGSVLVIYGRGTRYSVLCQYTVIKSLHLSFRWSQFFPGTSAPPDAVAKAAFSDIHSQVSWQF
jgi:hypothetical protein